MTLPLHIPGTTSKRRRSIHVKILGGLLVGAVTGLAANLASRNGLLDPTSLGWFISHVTRPLGQIFLNMLFMVVVPIVFSSLSLGVAKLGDVGQLGRLGPFRRRPDAPAPTSGADDHASRRGGSGCLSSSSSSAT